MAHLVIGAGRFGSVLARRLAETAAVRDQVRDPDRPEHLALAALPDIEVEPAGTPAGAAEIVFLCTPWEHTLEALRGLGDLSGRIVVDCTNPLTTGPDGAWLAELPEGSGGAAVAAALPGAHVVKTLNQVGAAVLSDPGAFPAPPAMHLACDDAGAKERVAAILADLGLAPLDAGPIRAAAHLEAVAILWIRRAFGGAGPGFCFALQEAR